MWLKFTSCTFASIAAHAFMKKQYICGLMWLIQNNLSILHHSHHANPNTYQGGNLVHLLDRIVANSNWLYAAWRCMHLPLFKLAPNIVRASLLHTFLIFFCHLIHTKHPDYHPPYNWQVIHAHASLHLVSAIGMHAILYLDPDQDRIYIY